MTRVEPDAALMKSRRRPAVFESDRNVAELETVSLHPIEEAAVLVVLDVDLVMGATCHVRSTLASRR